MAVSVASDFKIYNAEFNSGMYEALAENTQIFNANSRGGIIMVSEEHRGEYVKEAMFKQIASLITRQDLTSTSSVTPKKLEQIEEVSVKCNRKIGPVDMTLNAFKMAGLETPDGSYRLGRLVGDAVAKDLADIAIISVAAAVGGQSALIYDVTGETVKTVTFEALLKTKQKWGDQFMKLAAWLISSKPFFDLAIKGLDYNIESVAGLTIASGQLLNAAGGAFVVTDNSNLTNSGSPSTYNTIGLAAGACLVRESQMQTIVLDWVTGTEQLTLRLQGEYAATVGVDGFTWDVTNGAGNPTAATLGTTTNWDKVRTDTVGLPLVKLLSQ